MFFLPLTTFPQEELSRTSRDDRPSVPAVLSERKMDSAAVGNNNKVKVMATQLLAKFEENAPTQPTGLKRQVWKKLVVSFCGFTAGGGGNEDSATGKRCRSLLDVLGAAVIFAH